MSEESRPKILHCFADYGVESEVLVKYGDVVRIGINAKDTNESIPVVGDAAALPIDESVTFDLGIFHPPCTLWASLTSISGDPDDHVNLIPLARKIARKYCNEWVIENKPQAPLHDPVVLEGRMFGLPISFERGFESSFDIPQPPRYQKIVGNKKVETSPFFFSERSKRWWGSVKGYRHERYPKEHLAKNCIPAPYIEHIIRGWMEVYEEQTGETRGRPDYSNYDERMDRQRKIGFNRSLAEFDANVLK